MEAKRIIHKLGVVGVLAVGSAVAQVSTGIQPFGSYTQTTFETIDNGSLNAHFEIPIIAKAGRGMPFTYTLTYDTSLWTPVTTGSTQTWTPSGGWGWNAVTQAFTGYITFSWTPQQTQNCHNGSSTWALASNFQYVDALGANHQFPGAIAYFSQLTSGCGPTSLPSAEAVTASDGSGYTLSAAITTLSESSVTASVQGKSGGQIGAPLQTQTGAASLQDANGNQISFNPSTGQFTDTLGTTVLTVTGSGSPSSPVKLTYTNPKGTTSTFTISYITETIKTNFSCSGIGEFGGSGGTSQNLVSTIALPDGTNYQFDYEKTYGSPTTYTGRLAHVILPTGGQIYYSYDLSGAGHNYITCADGSASQFQHNQGNWLRKFTQSRGTSWTEMTDPLGNETDFNFQTATASSGNAIYFYETQRKTYTGAALNNTPLQTVSTGYNGTAVTTPCAAGTLSIPISQVEKTLTWPGNQESQVCSNYDGYGNIIQTLETDYGAGAVGSLLRNTVDRYGSPTSTPPLGNGIYSFLLETTVKDGSGNTFADTVFTPDNASPYGSLPVTSNVSTQHVSVSGSRGNVTAVQKLVSGTTNYLLWKYSVYDTGMTQQVTDPNASTTTMAYTTGLASCYGAFPTSVSEPLSLSTSSTWDCNGGVQLTYTDESGQSTGNKTTWTFSDQNYWRPTTVTDPTAAATTLSYPTSPTAVDGTMSVSSSGVANVRVTLDGWGRVSTTQAKQSPSSSSYDSLQTSYDGADRLSLTTVPYSGTAGQTGVTSTGTTVVYDGLNRPTQVTDGGGGWTKYTYQGNNDVLIEVGPLAPNDLHTKKRQIEYDGLGRITSVCEVSSINLTGTSYGACGQNTAQNGYLTSYTYDPLNDVLNIKQNKQTCSGGCGASPQSRTFTYDYLGRKLSESHPETNGTATTYTYDTDSTCASTSNGDVVKRIDPAGNTSCYFYDALHRVTSISYPSGVYASVTPTKTFVYDGATTVNGATMHNAKTRLSEAYTGSVMSKTTDQGFSYTARGEISDTYQYSPHNGSTYIHISASYWSNGLLDVLSSNISQFPTLTTTPDGEGRVSTVAASSGPAPVTSTQYDTAGHVTGVTYNSSDSDSFQFDANTERPTYFGFTVNSQTKSGTITNNTNGTLQKLAVSDPFNAADTQTCNFTYDDLSRLSLDDCGTAWGAAYSYDSFGNIAKSTYGGHTGTTFQAVYNEANNHITSVGSTTPTYDGNGNVTYDGFHNYGWDAEGNLITVDGATGTFDALNRRVELGNSPTYSQVLYPPFDPTFQMGSASALTTGGARFPLPGGGQIVYYTTQTQFRHPNWQGSEPMTSYANGTTPNVGEAFTPFGEIYDAYSGGDNGYFAGMLMVVDSGAALDAFNATARMYQSQAGRWVSPDPAGLGAVDLGNPQTLNRYAYAMNNPLSNVDPSGLKDDCGGPCTPFSYYDDQGCIISVTYFQDSNGYDIPRFGRICSGNTSFGAGIYGGAFGGGSLGSAPNNATPWYKTCSASALFSGAGSIAIDAIGLIPEAEGFTKVFENEAGYQIARSAGNSLGYRGIVATQQGAKAVTQGKGAISAISGAFGLGDTSAQGRLSTGLTVAGFIPGLGTLAAGVSIVNDAIKTGIAVAKCP